VRGIRDELPLLAERFAEGEQRAALAAEQRAIDEVAGRYRVEAGRT